MLTPQSRSSVSDFERSRSLRFSSGPAIFPSEQPQRSGHEERSASHCTRRAAFGRAAALLTGCADSSLSVPKSEWEAPRRNTQRIPQAYSESRAVFACRWTRGREAACGDCF